MKTRNNICDYIPDKQYRFYYEQLSKDEKAVYDTIRDNLLVCTSNRFIIPNSPRNYKIPRIVDYILKDIPEIFYLRRFSLHPVGDVVTAEAEYTHSIDEILTILHELEERVKELNPYYIIASSEDKIKAIVNYLSRSMSYCNEGRSTHTLESLYKNSGCCQGISSSFKYLADRLNLDSAIVSCRKRNTLVWHCLNAVVSDDIYFVDVTNALAYPKPYTSPYFHIKTEKVLENYEDISVSHILERR